MITERIHADFETFSKLDVRQVGSYRYAHHPSTEVLILCWSYGSEDQIYTWLPGQPLPKHLTDKIEEGWEIEAHNSGFERAIWEQIMVKQHGAPPTEIEQWSCTAIRAAAAGLPRALDKALAAMGSEIRKDPEGQRLIQMFSKPRKVPRKQEWVRTRPEDKPVEFKKFISYCKQDVRGELWLSSHVPELHPMFRKLAVLDMKMNERGIPIDLESVEKAEVIVEELRAKLNARIRKLSGGINASQQAKFLQVLQDMDVDIENLKAQGLKDLLKKKDHGLTDEAIELITMRLEVGKASTSKLDAMKRCAIKDKRGWVVRGGFLMNGAHTGRYAGRLIQPQNFVRGFLKPHQMQLVFDLIAMGDADLFDIFFDSPVDMISQSMRGFIMAPEGYQFYVVDYKAIEARILAWCCDHRVMLKAYRDGLDVYRIMAGLLFNKKPEDVTTEERRIGKNLVLGCGYGLGGKNFVGYCEKEGLYIEESFAVRAVKIYRKGAQPIVESWGEVERAAVAAVKDPGTSHRACKCVWAMSGRWLTCKLPSGRKLRYMDPRVERGQKFGKPCDILSFRSEFKGKWIRERTWGGTLIENIVQAMACDVMVEGMFSAEEAKYPVIGTVHDELITMRKVGTGNIKQLEKIACQLKPWMQGIPLESEGFECIRYRKG
jgi:DNA polymerase